MSFFKNVFGASDENETVQFPWIFITDLGQLNEILTVSTDKTVVIFKHSTSCYISKTALKQFEREFVLHNDIVPYYLDLLRYRPISNEIASRFEVQHQSPQIIVIKNGKAIYTASHENIDAIMLERFI
ncbi:bacillithiol system redox-active protein YtxJ [Flavobacterium sp. 25HG05S-40]|uniref:bacillithiol system redox-active protein YtxJ n=1 Tax=Flavobacterium sp. 25HG05S-40 TaxID=3458682 RepID=UPI00404452D6